VGPKVKKRGKFETLEMQRWNASWVREEDNILHVRGVGNNSGLLAQNWILCYAWAYRFRFR